MKSGWTYSNDSGNREKLAPNTLAANVMMSENGPDLLDFIRDYTHPVGSIWMTSGDQDPNVLFGGTWTKIVCTYTDDGRTACTPAPCQRNRHQQRMVLSPDQKYFRPLRKTRHDIRWGTVWFCLEQQLWRFAYAESDRYSR